jgi:predicted transcriptional regulator
MEDARTDGAGLWDDTSHVFRSWALHRAILACGWTVPEFARASMVHPASIYRALDGRRVRDSTAIRIFEALEKRQPMLIAV